MKKFLAMLLSLMMLLTPVLAAAQTPAELLDWAWQNGRAQEVTVSLNINEALLTATGEPEMEMVADIINAMSFSVTTAPQGPWKAALNMDGTEVLNVMGEGDDEMSCLGSTLLGGDVLAANDEEKLVIAGYLVDLMAQNEIITEDDRPWNGERLRAAFDFTRDTVQMAVQTGDGWTNIGQPHQLVYRLDHFMGCRVGLFVYSTQAAGGTACFRDFVYHAEEEKV